MQDDPIVYVVDDDDFMRELLLQVFRDAGLQAQAFASAGDLLTRGDLQRRCVLLLDVRMPDMSGPALQALLHDGGIHLPIIFLTGVSDVPIAVSAMRAGAVDYLTKPFDAAQLVDRVRHAFAREAPPARPHGLDFSRRLVTLTPREREVFDLMVTGMSSKHIGRALDCSFRTIDIHRGRVMNKMAARSVAQLVLMKVEAR